MPNVTITSLAQQLGISKASVSYALNGRPGVSEETREKVLALAAALGWYPSSSARALSQSRSETIGIVLLRDPAHVGSEPFYLSVLAGIEAVLGEREQNLMLRIVAPDTAGDCATERRDLAVYRRWVGEGRVDGVLLFDESSNDPRGQLLNDLGLPFVVVGGTRALATRSAATVVDQSADAATVVQALHELGHRRIGYISGLPTLGHERARSAAVVDHAQALGISAVVTASDYTAADGEMATIALMAGLDPASKDFPTALFYGNDLMAVGGLAGLKKLGISVPEQVSVVSWDDSIMCQFSSPPVAALNRDIGELGRQSALLLLDIVQGHERANVPMPAGILRRRTSLAAARS
ncbi:DNA-binding transcriptional regulator, LacI/PurR family [Arthrobacter alpinus]|uniref:DNA-binding transcriptional regulator, LacI/PurR family n=1 Tax=Arthrobacter alpinus TaxID=656366 RepID=A0A1H5MAZ1_9MICC|nr:LacI family DNA-binding transcriptional regulator [Arthrobacter alpinus]SEE85598.1 DNA-binding transcriptional regulator, LacI/PurR family [Arthrobacter alpinus]